MKKLLRFAVIIIALSPFLSSCVVHHHHKKPAKKKVIVVPKGKDRVTVCCKGKTKVIPRSALKAHLRRGAYKGPCR